MDINQLVSSLTVSGGTLSISGKTLGPGLGTLWDQCFSSQPLVITGASVTASASEVVVTGRAPFLQTSGLPLTARFTVADGQTQAELTYGSGDSASGGSLPLTSLFARYLPGMPAPGDLGIDKLSLQLSPGSSYQLSTQVASAPKAWTIPVGKLNVKVENLGLSLTCPTSGSASGAFSGSARIGDFTLGLDSTVPGSVTLRGTFQKTSLKALIDQLCDQAVTLPGGFDLRFDTLAVQVSQSGSDYAFQASCALAGVGNFGFDARRFSSGKSGFAAGLSIGSGALSKVQGLDGLAPLEKFVKLSKVSLVAASFEDAQFALPIDGITGVKPGLTAAAEWTIDVANKQQGLLKALLALEGAQKVALRVGTNPAQDSQLTVSKTATLLKRPFTCAFGVQLQNGSPSFFLTGSLTVEIQKQPQTFDLATTFVAGGAFLAATMKGATAITCGPFKLSNLALQIGVNWGGIPSLGVAATIDVKTFSSSVAVFFDSTNPARSLVAGSLDTLTAKDILDALVGGGLKTPIDAVLAGIALRGTQKFTLPGTLADALDGLSFDQVSSAFGAAKVTIPSASDQLTVVAKKKGSSWHLTDLSTMRHYSLVKSGDSIQAEVAPQFYFAPQATAIGSLQYPQAYYVSAALSFLGFSASATVDISESKGFAVDAQMDKVVLVDEKFFSITAASGGGGPKLSIATFSQPANATAELRAPHVLINGALTLFGLKRALYASVGTEGVDFELTGPLMPGVVFDVDVRFAKSGLDAGGSLKVGIGTIDLGPLGKAKINTDVDATLDLDIDAGGVSIALQSHFEFAGQGFQIAKFKVDAKADTFASFPALLSKQIENTLKDAYKDVNKWAQAVGKGALDGVNDTEQVLRDVYGKSANEAKSIATSVGKATASTVTSAANTVSNAASSAAKDVGKTASSTAKKIKKVFKF